MIAVFEAGVSRPATKVDYFDFDMLVRWVDGEKLCVRKEGTAY